MRWFEGIARATTDLSLDAPLVAVLWSAFLGQVNGIQPGSVRLFLLFAAVWLAYAADRLIDCARMRSDQITTRRHAFVRRHTRTLTILWVLVFVSSVLLAFDWMTRSEWLHGLQLTAAVVFYLVMVSLAGRGVTGSVMKKSFAALLFTAGVFFFPYVHWFAWGMRPEDGVQWTAEFMAVVCMAGANLFLIATWEAKVRRPHLIRVFRASFVVCLVLASGVVWLAGPVPAMAVALANLLLCALWWSGERIDFPLRRFLADAALAVGAMAGLIATAWFAGGS